MSHKEDEVNEGELDSLAEALLRRFENALFLTDSLDPDERKEFVEKRGIRDYYHWAFSSEDVKPFRTIEGEYAVLEPGETLSLPQPSNPSEPQSPTQE